MLKYWLSRKIDMLLFVIISKLKYFFLKVYLRKLKLKNGYTVSLTKGLSLHAEFTIARRSLYQLIYDKADDWLNPKNV